jgi:sugar/nucleoside kinase (ribokinase family)
MDHFAKPIEYLSLGHVTADVTPDGNETLGGAATYATLTAAALGLRASLVTRAEDGFLQRHQLPDDMWYCGAASSTTRFANVYSPAGDREQTVVGRAEPLRPQDVPDEWRDVRILHVAPVLHEIGEDVVEVIRAEFVGVSPQGWTRSVGSNGEVRSMPLELPDGIVEMADAIVVSHEDLAARPKSAQDLAQRIPIVVVTYGRDGALALVGGEEITQPAYLARSIDPTGAGDVFAAAFFVWLNETGDAALALSFAAAAAALSVEGHGVAGIGSRDRVLARMRE